MSEHSTPSAFEMIAAFEQAVIDYSATRRDLTGLGALIAMRDGAPTGLQRERLKQLTADHFMAGEELKAMAMTLLSDGLLVRCGVLIRLHGEELH